MSAKKVKSFRCPHCGKSIPAKLVAEHTGREGGKKLAEERGPDYFRKLQSKRKTRAGGRPPSKKKARKTKKP